ncbi:hypothetical protein DSO57_1012081 [Entomophthora muscae]|uniref:Uncharacterized protein n=1 Tax=Entomophthora muscae TaxID=34485 RepID=A0ACC2TTW5_9FUNG|nr:hypothetical protein DSO57_1012081 [Entomophthora muscae]
MGDQEDNHSYENSTFLFSSISSYHESEESYSDSDQESGDQINGISFDVPPGLLEQFPFENPGMSLIYALREQYPLSDQESGPQNDTTSNNLNRPQHGLNARSGLALGTYRPNPASIEFGRRLMPYFRNHLRGLQGRDPVDFGQEIIPSDSEVSSMSILEEDLDGRNESDTESETYLNEVPMRKASLGQSFPTKSKAAQAIVFFFLVLMLVATIVLLFLLYESGSSTPGITWPPNSQLYD